jgi:hypothetical protein
VINAVITFLGEQEATLDMPCIRFTDTTALDRIDLNFNYVFHVAALFSTPLLFWTSLSEIGVFGRQPRVSPLFLSFMLC